MASESIDTKSLKKLISLAEKLQEEGSSSKINVFQPGAMKEIKMASLLGHNWVSSKKNADACSKDGKELYEYLSAAEGKAVQIDRVFKNAPGYADKYKKSMDRIMRNKWIYFAFTNPDITRPLDILRIYEIEPDIVKQEADRILTNSQNIISHLLSMRTSQRKTAN